MGTASFLFRLTLVVATVHVVVVAAAAASGGGNVTYDGRSLIIGGQRRLLFSGSIHYPRSTPEMWPSLISKAKEGGIDVIQTYVFWNLHEPQQGKYDFSGRRDLVRFIKEIQAQGLLVCLRIGPYIESEWTYGGLPFWLHDIPGIVFRSDNEPFKFQMERFVTQIVNKMKSENLFASQGGPIILSQIENEYTTVEAAFHDKGPPYVRWAAQMAVGLQTGVPWLMCKQDDAPDPVINACNGMQCGQTFAGPNSPNKPSIWTENWTSFYQAYSEEPYSRSAKDIAFHVALFIAKNGSYVNYYMYHGGTNFGRSASAFMITSYYDQAPLDEYGLIRQPKYGHLQKMHLAIKLCSKALLYGTSFNFPLGPLQYAFVFRGKSRECAAFLVNHKAKSTRVKFQNLAFDLPGESISILPDCKTEIFNTAKVSTKSNRRTIRRRQKLSLKQQWQEFKEGIPSFDTMSSRANTLLDQISTTKDTSDYLWYTMRIHSDSNAQTELKALSQGHILHAFVNGRYIGAGHGNHANPVFSLQQIISLKKGNNYISFLSVMVGLPNSGAYLERRTAGLRKVMIQGRSYTDYPWGYQVGLFGERKGIYSGFGHNKIRWNSFGSSASRQLIWYKTVFDAPPGNDPVVLNLRMMGKGEVWINGQSIGRYWVSFHTAKGSPSQTWYHIPRSFLKSRGNLLILLEEESGNPLGITIDTVTSI